MDADLATSGSSAGSDQEESDDGDDEIPTLTLLDDDDEPPLLLNVDEPDTTPPRNAAAATTAATASTAATVPNDCTAETALPPVPVTILTGFLGSGKTTLIRHILSSPDHGYRIAVIENEFGGGDTSEVGNVLPSSSATSSSAERTGLSVESMIARDGADGTNLTDLIELPNGCVCCTVKDSLVETLENLLAKKSDLDYVLIEASGMANPGPIASVFWLDDALESRLRLDGVVACVDARNILMQLEETSGRNNGDHDGSAQDGGGGEEAAQQIAYADRIIVNKIDLLCQSMDAEDEDDAAAAVARPPQNRSRHTHTLECVLDEIRAINPTAPLRPTTYSQIPDLTWILDAKCFDVERAQDVETAFAAADQQDDVSPSAAAAQDIAGEGHACSGGDACDHNHQHDHDHDRATPPRQQSRTRGPSHTHTSSIGTTALIRSGSVDLRKMNSWLASVLWPDQDEADSVLRARLEKLMAEEEKVTSFGDGQATSQPPQPRRDRMQIFRIKGIVSVRHPLDCDGRVLTDDLDDGPTSDAIDENGLDRRRYIVQSVNDLWEIHPASDSLRWAEGGDGEEDRICKLVFIGRRLDRKSLLDGFESCFS